MLDDRQHTELQAADRQPTGCRQAADRLPTGSRQAADRLPTGCRQAARQAADRLPTGCRQAADRLPTGSRGFLLQKSVIINENESSGLNTWTWYTYLWTYCDFLRNSLWIKIRRSAKKSQEKRLFINFINSVSHTEEQDEIMEKSFLKSGFSKVILKTLAELQRWRSHHLCVTC